MPWSKDDLFSIMILFQVYVHCTDQEDKGYYSIFLNTTSTRSGLQITVEMYPLHELIGGTPAGHHR